MGDYLLSPIPILAGILRPAISKFSQEVLDHVGEESLIVEIKEDRSGVEIQHSQPLKFNQDSLFNYLLDNLRFPFSVLNNPEASEEDINREIIKIYHLVSHSLKINVIYKLPLPIIEGRKKVIDCKELQQIILNNANQRDKEFVTQITRTQMLTYFIESNYCS